MPSYILTEKARDKVVNQLMANHALRKGSRRYKELVTQKYGGDYFWRKCVENDRTYWQRGHYIYVNGERKFQVIKKQARKPREC